MNAFVSYGREEEINRSFSAIADVRILWGGDRTIEEIRRVAPLPAHAIDTGFADRYSLCVLGGTEFWRSIQLACIGSQAAFSMTATSWTRMPAPRHAWFCGWEEKRRPRARWTVSGVRWRRRRRSGIRCRRS